MKFKVSRIVATVAVSVLGVTAWADDMRLAVTTSFHNSGLSEVLLPEIKADLDLDVHLLVVGTGQAIRLGQAGDVDAILVHSKTAEDRFVSEGYGTHRTEIMYNDFVLIGPAEDPARIAGADSAAEALSRISTAKAPFTSRGDDSGTHKKELALWAASGVTEEARSTRWYKAVGAGMGATLNTASGLGGYVMSDRASWLKFANKGGLELLFAGDPVLFNQYAYLPVDPTRHPHANDAAAQALEDWLISDRAQSLINGYRLNGEALFIFNAEGGS